MRARRADWFSIARTSQQHDSKFYEFESVDLSGVFPCPWIVEIHLEIVHSDHP